MHKNRLWIVFLTLVTLTTIWFVGNTVNKLFVYRSYDKTAVINVVDWEVEEMQSDRFQIRGGFLFKGKKHNSLLQSPRFYNSWSADQYVEKMKDQGSWRIWYVSKDASRATLQKRFPFKECVSTAFLVAILLYFIGLGIYVGKKQN